MNDARYTFTAHVWIYPGEAAWHFISLPEKYTDEIKMITQPKRRGFGSVKVSVSAQNIAWKTSIFPDSKTRCYILPVKKQVRKQLGLTAGSSIELTVKIDEDL